MSQRLLKMTVNLCRIIVALTFIFSGFVKAIDPIGLQYKLQDYLGAIGIPGFLPDWMLLIMAVLLAAVEFCMGIFLLFAIQRRLISKLIVVFMSIMTLITVWLVVANPVKDCGCFGDALHWAVQSSSCEDLWRCSASFQKATSGLSSTIRLCLSLSAAV